MFKACIFDLDGTLANTLESMAYVTNIILKKYNLKELPVDGFRYYSGEGAHMLVQRCLKDAGDVELRYLPEAENMYREMFAADPMYKVIHYEGMPETIKQLKKRGAKLAVCSNKPHPAAVKVIKEMFHDDFDIILGQSDRIPRKPSPAGPLKIAEEFQISPEECMYVGDTRTDMETGKAAGMYTVGALWGFRDRQELETSGADFVAEKPVDLLKIYEGRKND